MIEDFFRRSEGKTLEFKENTRGLQGILKTVIAFANTSGGVIVIGVKDKSKEVLGLKSSLLEEENNQFRITLFSLKQRKISMNTWENKLVNYLQANESIKSQEAAKLWKISDRATRNRLKKMLTDGFIVRISTSVKDPHSIFVLVEKYLARNSN